jgi:cyanophycinase
MPSDVIRKPNIESRRVLGLKPIYLFADSRLLFQQRADGSLFLNDVVENAGVTPPSVAYIGASNGDNPSFYQDLFLPAFEPTGVGERRMIVSRPSPEDRLFLEHADIILLAGGSVEAGWRAFEENGFRSLIEQRYLAGAILLGVSAGAVQVGRGGLTDDESVFLPTFGLLPLYVGVHEEQENWKSLRRAISLQELPIHAIGIPSGGGVMYYEGEVLPIEKPLFEIQVGLTGSQEAQLYPNQSSTSSGPKPS